MFLTFLCVLFFTFRTNAATFIAPYLHLLMLLLIILCFSFHFLPLPFCLSFPYFFSIFLSFFFLISYFDFTFNFNFISSTSISYFTSPGRPCPFLTSLFLSFFFFLVYLFQLQLQLQPQFRTSPYLTLLCLALLHPSTTSLAVLGVDLVVLMVLDVAMQMIGTVALISVDGRRHRRCKMGPTCGSWPWQAVLPFFLPFFLSFVRSVLFWCSNFSYSFLEMISFFSHKCSGFLYFLVVLSSFLPFFFLSRLSLFRSASLL